MMLDHDVAANDDHNYGRKHVGKHLCSRNDNNTNNGDYVYCDKNGDVDHAPLIQSKTQQ